MIEQIKLELTQLSKMEGIILSEITDLPERVRLVVSKLVQHRSISLVEMMDIFQLDQTDAHNLGTLLVDKGILARLEQTDGTASENIMENSTYSLRFGRNRRPQVVPELWDLFDEL